MTNDSIITSNGKKVILYRGYTETADLSATQYLPATKFMVGIDATTPSITDTSLNLPVPITNGTVLDAAAKSWSGSLGADDSTDNITTYKQGCAIIDNTSQSFSGSVQKLRLWEMDSLSGSFNACPLSDYAAFWLYIKDATALAKIDSVSGSAIQLRLGNSSGSYYYHDWARSELSVGWNFLTTWSGSVGTLSSIGTPTTSGTVDYAAIAISGSEASTIFVAGDIIYDLLRSYDDDDLRKDFQTGYPTFDFTNLEVTQRGYLTTLDANGFLIDNLGIINEDAAELLLSEDAFEGESKSNTDEFALVAVDRIV